MADEAVREVRVSMASFDQEATEVKARIRAEAGPITQPAAQAAAATSGTPGAVQFDVAPGFLLHSNHIDPEEMKGLFLAHPELSGISLQQSAAVT